MRSSRSVAFAIALAALAACREEPKGGPPGSGSPAAEAPVPAPAAPTAAPVAQIPLDPAASPVPFRRLADGSLLVDPSVDARALAGLGNLVARAAGDLPAARLEVWDDETAWRASGESPASPTPEPGGVTHRRAEYVRGPAVETFIAYAPDGTVGYERDFKDWPLSDLDTPSP